MCGSRAHHGQEHRERDERQLDRQPAREDRQRNARDTCDDDQASRRTRRTPRTLRVAWRRRRTRTRWWRPACTPARARGWATCARRNADGGDRRPRIRYGRRRCGRAASGDQPKTAEHRSGERERDRDSRDAREALAHLLVLHVLDRVAGERAVVDRALLRGAVEALVDRDLVEPVGGRARERAGERGEGQRDDDCAHREQHDARATPQSCTRPFIGHLPTFQRSSRGFRSRARAPARGRRRRRRRRAAPRAPRPP